MKHNRTKAILTFLAAAALFTSCKPKPDTDLPFPPSVSPSVFIGSQNQFVYAIDPITGVKKWECNVGANIKSSPVLFDGILFTGTASVILFKIDPNTGAKGQSKQGFPYFILTTPVGKDGHLFISTGNELKSLHIQPDTFSWTFTAGGPINSSPMVKDTQLVFGCDDGFVYNIDNRSGNLIWKSANFATLFNCSPAMDTSTIYIGGEDGYMYALLRKDGSVRWKYLTGAAKPIKSSPLVYDGNVIFGNDDNKLFCLENIYGTPRWVTPTTDRVRSSPYLYGQTIFFGCYDKSFYAVNALNGSIKWAFPTPGGLIASSPVCYKNFVYFGSYDKYLYALDTGSAKVQWKYAINGLIDCSPSIDPNNSDGTGINSTISGASIY